MAATASRAAATPVGGLLRAAAALSTTISIRRLPTSGAPAVPRAAAVPIRALRSAPDGDTALDSGFAAFPPP